jgi:sorting nexin-13
LESPKKRKIVSGNKQVDNLLHTIIDYVLRDFIESWFKHVSTDKQFSETVRDQIETFLTNICKRVKNAQILSLMTTKLIDDVAQHAKICRVATEATKSQDAKKERPPDRLSPQRADSFHRRNKSETDAGWHLGNAATQKNVANSRFYGVQTDESSLMNPELRFLNAFFDESDQFREECMDERKLETYLTHVMETVMYFSMPPDEFDCLPLRSLLCTLLANVVLKPMIHLLSDPDFINLQIARYAKEQPPAGEFLLKMIRQCNDLSELRAVRQFITKEMDSKHQDPAAVAELASLKYTQKLIDLRISNLQNNRNGEWSQGVVEKTVF